MRKIIGSVAAAGLLVGGAFMAGLAGSPTVAAAQDGEEPPAVETPVRPDRRAVVDEVLVGLVDDGVITRDQADQIKEAIVARAQELRQRHDTFRDGFRRGARFGFRLRSMLADGVVDTEELAGLPEDHPLLADDGPLAEYLEDGELTIDELRMAREQHRRQRQSADGGESGLGA